MIKRNETINPAQDSTLEAERVLVEMMRCAPMWKRAAQLDDLISTRRALILADLHRRYPQADADELRKRLATRLLPREEVIRIFDWDPEKEG